MIGSEGLETGSLSEKVVSYLARCCANRVVIANDRLIKIKDGEVYFWYKDYLQYRINPLVNWGTIMGFFSDLFGNPNSLEAKLVDEYAVVFQASGISPNEAKEAARDMLKQAKQLVAQSQQSIPPNYGDLLLEREGSDPKIHATLKSLRAEGVRDEDIRWWWNMSELERVMLDKSDELIRRMGFLGAVRQGLDPEQATKEVWSTHPKLGYIEDCEGEDDDRPLPFELKRRIVQFTERHYNSPDLLRQKMAQATSFNALVRAEIRAGTI